jgi:hypothetical protein
VLSLLLCLGFFSGGTWPNVFAHTSFSSSEISCYVHFLLFFLDLFLYISLFWFVIWRRRKRSFCRPPQANDVVQGFFFPLSFPSIGFSE